MSLLVTGGTGFIGSHLLEALVHQKEDIILLKRKNSDTCRIDQILSKMHVYDISQKFDFDHIFKKHQIDGIIHVAVKYVKNHSTTNEILEMNRSNIDFPSILLESAIRNKTKFFINTGTFFEYKLIGALKENSILSPDSYYSITKVVFDSILKFRAEKSTIKAVTLRLFSPYGEKDNDKIIFQLISAHLNNKPISATKGLQRLAFTYILDIVDAYLKAINYLRKGKNIPSHQVFNIGNSNSVSLREIEEILQSISGKKNIVKFGAIHNRNDESIKIKCDSEKARKKIKWKAKIDIRTGLARTYNFYNTQKK